MQQQPFFKWIVWGYVLFISLWLILRLLFGDRLWWLALLNTIAFFLFFPLPVLLVASLWNRRWRSLLGLSIPIVAFGMLYGALLLPSFVARSPQNGYPITVMSFNVALENTNYPPLARTIRAANPDIVGLQELIPSLAKSLVQELATDYPYNTLTSTEPGEPEAVGVLSKFPIESNMRFPLPGIRYGMNLQTKTAYVAPGPRLGVRAALRVNGKRIQVGVADLWHNATLKAPLNQWESVAAEFYQSKVQEIERLKQELFDRGDPFLFLCDCNFTDTSETHAKFTQFAKDSFREVGQGFGHTASYVAGIPSQRIDYIWHSSDFVALAAIAGPDNGGSDHLPVVAKLQLSS